MQRNDLTLPNLLTAGRLALAPCVAWALLTSRQETGFWLFAVAALTDALDGGLARLLNQRSVLGAWLDPIADKVMLLSTLLILVWLDFLPLWLGVLVLARDIVVLLGAAAYRALTGGLKVAPTWLGKMATATEFVLVTVAMAHLAFGWFAGPLSYLILVTGGLVLASGLHYVWVWTAKTRMWCRTRAG